MNLCIILIAPKFTYYCISDLLLLHFKSRLLLHFICVYYCKIINSGWFSITTSFFWDNMKKQVLSNYNIVIYLLLHFRSVTTAF